MRRADRLFRIVQLLRRRRTIVTAKQIAEKLEISERTVYRDIRDLIPAGTSIDGEAGVGYRLQPGYDLPPLMFDREEIQALVLGARIVAQFGDPALARASESILSKVAGVLPKELEPLLADTRLFVPKTGSSARSAAGLAVAREALVAQRRMRLKNANEKGEETERDVRPLGVFFWGKTWTLAAVRPGRGQAARLTTNHERRTANVAMEPMAAGRVSSWPARTRTRARAASARCTPCR